MFIFNSDIKKRNNYLYRVTKAGVVLAKNINDKSLISEEVVCFLPIEISKKIYKNWNEYEFELTEEGHIIGKEKRINKGMG